MTQNVASRLDVKMRKRVCPIHTCLGRSCSNPTCADDIPDGLFRQMTTCQTAANEFLRQFWLAIYPPPSESQTLAPATPAQKAAKAAKMVVYLAKTYEKVEALVRAAHQEGVDPARVKIVRASIPVLSFDRSVIADTPVLQAMKPVVDAVDKALEFWRAKNAKVLR